MSSVIFFADTHLNVTRPDKTQKVISFIKIQPRNTVFYILGDFFDFWIGPRHLELDDYRALLMEIRNLTSAGVRINFIPGNRDFTVGSEITAAAGIKVLSETETVRLGGHKVLLTHGDIFCSEDRSYQSYRRLSRARIVKSICKSLPLNIGLHLGRQVRGYSSDVVPRKSLVSRNIIDAVLNRYFRKGHDAIICGHVHKKQVREVMPGKTLFVLGDWQGQGSYVEYQDGQFVLKDVL
jgi:UDP-2,3-diacylglucosamine hydrolase